MRILLGGIAALVLLTWLIWPRALPPMSADIAGLSTRPDAHEPWQFNHYKITPMEPFEIEGRVLHAQHYSSDRESQLAPIDLALGWGRMADPAVLSSLTFSQSERWYFYQYTTLPIPVGEINSSSKNLHMIPADEGVRTTLFNLHDGQTVKISGYLVRADSSDGWHWVSNISLTRTGSHSCLLVWADTIEVR